MWKRSRMCRASEHFSQLQIGLPHVRADEHDFGNDLLAHGGKESLKGFDGSFLADPEQAGDANIDLVYQRQILAAFGVLDFIDANGVDLAERAVLQSPGDDMFDRIENLVPASAKALRGFFPRKPSRATGQEKHIVLAQRAFAVAPRDFLDRYHAAAAAIDPPHGVQQEDEESPLRNELVAPFSELVVSGRRQMAARADCRRTSARSHDHFDAPLVGAETGVLIDKPSEMAAAVQDRGQFHGGETSTLNRLQTQARDLGKPSASRQDLSPGRKCGSGRSPAPKSETTTHPAGFVSAAPSAAGDCRRATSSSRVYTSSCGPKRFC